MASFWFRDEGRTSYMRAVATNSVIVVTFTHFRWRNKLCDTATGLMVSILHRCILQVIYAKFPISILRVCVTLWLAPGLGNGETLQWAWCDLLVSFQTNWQSVCWIVWAGRVRETLWRYSPTARRQCIFILTTYPDQVFCFSRLYD